jgi:hypothetical protein
MVAPCTMVKPYAGELTCAWSGAVLPEIQEKKMDATNPKTKRIKRFIGFSSRKMTMWLDDKVRKKPDESVRK